VPASGTTGRKPHHARNNRVWTERTFRIFIGAALLLGLYFDLKPLIYTLIGILAFQGITNWRVTRIISRLRYGSTVALGPCCYTGAGRPVRPGQF